MRWWENFWLRQRHPVLRSQLITALMAGTVVEVAQVVLLVVLVQVEILMLHLETLNKILLLLALRNGSAQIGRRVRC